VISRKLFRSKIVYWISAVFFTLYGFLSIVSVISKLRDGTDYSIISFAILMVLSIVIAVMVFHKEKNTIRMINLFICLLIPVSLWDSISIYETHYIYHPEVLWSVLGMIVYLYFVNKLRYNHRIADEINEIGANK